MSEDVSEDVSVERLSVAEAAAALGVTRDAIHKRITRDTIKHEKGDDGRFYVYVDTSTSGLDLSADKSKDESKVEVLERLIESHEKRIESLERQLERRGDEAARLQQAIFTLTQANAQLATRVPELEAPHEVTEDAETIEDEQELDTERARREMAESTMREGMDEERWRREEAERERDELRKELFAVRRQRESPETVGEEQKRAEEPRSYVPGAQTATQRPQGGGLRGLRRRILGW